MFLLRQLTRDLHQIQLALDRQNALIARIADHFAPADPATDRELVKADTGLSHLDPIEAGLAVDYVEKIRAQLGHSPDDEEILSYLAEEKTHDLRERLTERDAEMDRLTGAKG
jgi:hypothetical protein